MASAPVHDSLSALTEIQASAARWGEGPLLVLAGPGSGKTRVLTSRIARLLAESPNAAFRVLALTFTNKAADEMRARVEQLVPDLAQRVFLGTFHSFCADVLRQHGSHVGVRPDFRIYSTRPDLDAVMAQAVEIARANDVAVRGNDRALYPVLERLRSSLIPPGEASVNVPEDLVDRIEGIYSAYEESLGRSNALDFASLVYLCVNLFRRYAPIGKIYRTAFTYWNIDEFQDTNAAQYELIRAMAGGRFENLFVVADDDQIIYQWNGASHKRLEEFKRDFRPEILQLPTNFRCPPEIVRIANNLIRHNSLRSPGKQDLVAAKPSTNRSDTIRLLAFDDVSDEAKGVAADIAMGRTGQWGRVAVLARTRRLLDGVQRELAALGVPAVVSQRRDSFVSAPYRLLTSVLTLANHRRDSRALEVLCLTFQLLTGKEVEPDVVATSARAKGDDFLRAWFDVARQLPGEDALPVIEAMERDLLRSGDFRQFVSRIQSWFIQIKPEDSEALEERFAGYEEDAAAWNELYSDVIHALGDSPTLEAFLQEVELRSKEPPLSANTVVLMTVHASKGKEFGHVYLVGLAEDQMPSFQARQKGSQSAEMEEERRNCFVAITRASESITISYANRYFGWQKEPSRFLSEMGFTAPRK